MKTEYPRYKKFFVYLFFNLLFLLFTVNISYSKSKRLSLDLVSGYDLSIDLKVDSLDLKPDLSKVSPKIKLFFIPSSLIDKTGKSRSVTFKAYEFIDGERFEISKISPTISNPKKVHQATLPLNYFQSPFRKVLLDLYNAQGTYVATYSLNLEAINFDSQISSDEETLIGSDCDNSIFGECQISYILENINFEAFPKRNPITQIFKQESGEYKVRIGVPLQTDATVKKSKVKYIDRSSGDGNGTTTGLDEVFFIVNGDVGLNVPVPQAVFHLDSGDQSKPPLIINPGPLTNNPVNGSLEFDGNNFYYSSNGSRKIIAHTGQLNGLGQVDVPDTLINKNLVNPNLSGLIDIEASSSIPTHKDGSTFLTEDGALCMSMDGKFNKISGPSEAACPNPSVLGYLQIDSIHAESDSYLGSAYFGWDTVLSDDKQSIFVGALWDREAATNAGAIYVFNKNPDSSWSQVDKLIPSGAASNTYCVPKDFDSERLLVSCYGENSFRGAAYIYKFNDVSGKWEETNKLVHSEADPYEYSGYYASMKGDLIVLNTGIFSANGHILSFHENGTTHNWDEIPAFFSDDGMAGDLFGYIGGFINSRIYLSSAQVHDNGASNIGALYFLEFNDSLNRWEQKKKLISSNLNTAALEGFGSGIYVDDKYLIVGSIENFLAYSPESKFYLHIYENNGSPLDWVFSQKITDDIKGSAFGFSGGSKALLRSNDLLYVSSKNLDRFYIYKKNNESNLWSLSNLVSKPHNDPKFSWSSWFGMGIFELDESTLLIGAPYESYMSENGEYLVHAGALYLYQKEFLNPSDTSYEMGFNSKAISSGSIAIGSNTQSNWVNSITIGSGNSFDDPLINQEPNSLSIGFNSNAATLFVGSASGGSSTGKVGIGTSSPVDRLEVKGNIRTSGLSTEYDSQWIGGVVLPGGHHQRDPVILRFDQNILAYANKWATVTTSPVFDASSLFNLENSLIDLNSINSGSDVVIEVDLPQAISSNVYDEFLPFVLFYDTDYDFNGDLKIELKNNAGSWITAYEASVRSSEIGSPFIIRRASVSGGLKTAKFTFSSMKYRSWVKTIGVMSLGARPYQWTLNKGGDKVYGDLEFYDSYLKLDTNTGAPPNADCDSASEVGRMKVDDSSDSVYICAPSGWKTISL